jgi:hypothetical protein
LVLLTPPDVLVPLAFDGAGVSANMDELVPSADAGFASSAASVRSAVV